MGNGEPAAGCRLRPGWSAVDLAGRPAGLLARRAMEAMGRPTRRRLDAGPGFGCLRTDPPPILGHIDGSSAAHSPRAPALRYVARIGAATAGEANRLCERLRAAGGACDVMRNPR